MDRWELNVGDSLIDKVQGALGSSGAMLLILSKNSVESAWCKKEVNSGLIRELEEKRTLLLPCVIDDCVIPLFLREKLYADFRADPDQALKDVDRALAAISNPEQGRIDQFKYHTDWSVDWKEANDDRVIEFAFVDHGHEWPYVVLTRCIFVCNAGAASAFNKSLNMEKPIDFIKRMLGKMIKDAEPGGLSVILSDARESLLHSHVNLGRGIEADHDRLQKNGNR